MVCARVCALVGWGKGGGRRGYLSSPACSPGMSVARAEEVLGSRCTATYPCHAPLLEIVEVGRGFIPALLKRLVDLLLVLLQVGLDNLHKDNLCPLRALPHPPGSGGLPGGLRTGESC